MAASEASSVGFWFLAAFLAVSVLLMAVGQTTAVFDYDLAVRVGLQEATEEVGEFGVQINRAFGASDTAVYIPLMVVSLVGLWDRRFWSLITTAAVAGISVYWSVTMGFVLTFAPGVPGYTLEPGLEYALFLGAYAAFGIWCIGYLCIRGDAVLRRSH